MSHPPLKKTPFVLLGLMTVLTVVGPLAISQSIKGGASPGWPPDRPAEWWIFTLVTGAVVALMAACLGIGLRNWRKTVARQASGLHRREPISAPVDESFNSD